MSSAGVFSFQFVSRQAGKIFMEKLSSCPTLGRVLPSIETRVVCRVRWRKPPHTQRTQDMCLPTIKPQVYLTKEESKERKEMHTCTSKSNRTQNLTPLSHPVFSITTTKWTRNMFRFWVGQSPCRQSTTFALELFRRSRGLQHKFTLTLWLLTACMHTQRLQHIKINCIINVFVLC